MAKLLFMPFLLLIVSNQQYLCNGEFIYTSVSPLNIIPGEVYQISTTLEKADHPPVTFKYELSNEKSGVVASLEDISLAEPGSKVTTLPIKSDLLVEDSYNLTVTATDAEGKVERDRISIGKDDRKTSILIQTDKPIYKPGETVRFRVFLLNRFLLPFGDDKTVDITVFDPERNVIKLWKSTGITGGKGFVSEKFELSKEPNLGDWRFQVKADNGTEQESQSFSVDEYVLPKYKVEIKPSPSFVTYNQSKFVAEISALYSYGKPVNGECTAVMMGPANYYYGTSRRASSAIKTAKLEEGKGLAKFEFDVKSELNIEPHQVRKWGTDLQIVASCKDQASGNVRNATANIKLYEYPYKIELVDRQNRILPGFPVNFTIKVSTQDNVPISDERPDALKIEHGFNFNGEDGVILKSIPPNGLVPISFIAATNPKVCYEALDVTYKVLKESLWVPSKFISPTGSYIRLKRMTESPVEGQPIEVDVKTSKEYQAMNVFLISRGLIVHSERIPGTGGKEQTVKLTLPQKSSPKVKLFVYLIFNDNNIISEVMDLDVKPDEKNNLEISLSDKSLEPGSNVSISVKGHPNSIIGLRAVDQSVLLLKADDDLTIDKLRGVGDRFHSGGYWWGMGDSNFQNFFRNGLGLLTNLDIDKGDKLDRPLPVPEKIYDDGVKTVGGANHKVHFAAAMRPQAATAGFGAPGVDGVVGGPPLRVRSHFPETWIWEDSENADGQLTIHKQVPDTITSWQISAFQIDKEHGLGLAKESQKLTVFRPFFIALNLPYSVVKGEVLLLQVLVHNYQDKPVSAKVTLENQEDSFKFLESEDTFDKMEKDVELNASSIATVVFPIVPSKFGTITLAVKAVTNDAGDAVRRTLIVRPPGIKHTQNSAILVNLLTEEVFKQEKISAVFPEQRVPDADFLKVQAIGDVLGGTIDNLDKLIRLPTGCGEQNMLHFVPDVVILDYLNATGQLRPQVESRAKRYLERGYQQQLSYLRNDGSYSTFGKSDRVGSTWLTAFVTRAFIQAKRHVLIDDEAIKKSLRFLLRQQNDNGSFTEEGFVYDKSLQGGAGSGSNQLAITAYTLLTIAEAQKSDIDIAALNNKNKTAEEVISSGVEFLLSQASGDNIINDVYSINLISYLLHSINHPKKDDYFKMTEDLAKTDAEKGTIHWKQISRQKPSEFDSKLTYRPWQPRTTPATVELTSYGLLTYLLRGKDKLSDSVSIAKWLMKQRNSQGGFYSTQDTVVGITALAKFAEAINTKENSEADVHVKLSYGSDNVHDFNIGKDNRTVLQEYLLPGNTTEVSIEGSGKGTALAQLTWTYYVEAVDSSPAFDLKTELVDHDQGRNLDMKIDFSYNRDGKSNMAILEANTPSGYAFDQEELEALRRANVFKRYELEDKDSKVQLYFESVSSLPINLNLKAYRIYLVAKHAQGVVKVYDYYDNTQAAQYLYDVPAISLCDICKTEKSCDLKECK